MMIAFNAKVKEIAGEKAFVMNSGARNVGREFVHIRGRAGEMATPEEESIWTIWKPEMKRNLFFGSTLSIIIKGGWTWSTGCAPLGATPPLGQAAPGEGQHYQLQEAHADEQEE